MPSRARTFDQGQWSRDIEHLPLEHRRYAEMILDHARRKFDSQPYQIRHSQEVASDYKTILRSEQLGRWWLVINSRKDQLRLEFDDPADQVHAEHVSRGRQWPTKGQKWFTLPPAVRESELLALVDDAFSANPNNPARSQTA